MLSERMADLINKASAELARGTSPFETGWLTENEVTLEECAALASNCAVALWWFAETPATIQANAIALYIKDCAAEIESFRELFRGLRDEWL